MSGLVNVDLGSAIKAGGNLLDDLFTSDEERMNMQLQARTVEAGMQAGQMEINKAEAGHKSVFVAGWRPFIGWVGGLALAYKFLFYPMLIWVWYFCQAEGWIAKDAPPPPTINAQELYPIIMGMLGLGTMRTVEGIKKVKSNSISAGGQEKKSGFRWPWSKG